MKYVLGMISCFMVIALGYGENFYLIGNDGEKIGPIKGDSGQKIQINGKTYTYKSADSEKMKKKLESLIVKKFFVLEADISDVITLLQDKSLKVDVKEKKGVNVVYFPKTPYDAGKGKIVAQSKASEISLRLSNINMHALIKAIAKQAGANVVLGDSVVELHQQ